jgi:hypothetical protein
MMMAVSTMPQYSATGPSTDNLMMMNWKKIMTTKEFDLEDSRNLKIPTFEALMRLAGIAVTIKLCG